MGLAWARALVAGALFALPAGPARAAPYRAPPLTGHVVDAAGLLSPSERLDLDRRMEEIRARTGFELVALLVASLDGRAIEDVAYDSFNQWGIGRAGKDDGVLLVIAPTERKVRIETGKGAGGALTDVQASDIIERAVVPPLRAGRVGQAVAAGVEAIAATLTAGGPPSGAHAPALRLSWQTLAVLGGLFALLIVLLIVSPRFRSATWSVLQAILLFRLLGGRGGGGGSGGSGYSGGGGSSGGGGASGNY